MLERVYDQGYDARWDGVREEDNPYAGDIRSEEYRAWDDGWHACDKELDG